MSSQQLPTPRRLFVFTPSLQSISQSPLPSHVTIKKTHGTAVVYRLGIVERFPVRVHRKKKHWGRQTERERSGHMVAPHFAHQVVTWPITLSPAEGSRVKRRHLGARSGSGDRSLCRRVSVGWSVSLAARHRRWTRAMRPSGKCRPAGSAPWQGASAWTDSWRCVRAQQARRTQKTRLCRSKGSALH